MPGGYDVVITWNDTIRMTTFHDPAGEVVRVVTHIDGSGTISNSVTGYTLEGSSPTIETTWSRPHNPGVDTSPAASGTSFSRPAPSRTRPSTHQTLDIEATRAKPRYRQHAYEHVSVYARATSDHDLPQRVVLGALLEAHPRLLETGELAAQLPEVPRVSYVVRVLVDDGLATRIGDLVGASRAAVRFDALRR